MCFFIAFHKLAVGSNRKNPGPVPGQGRVRNRLHPGSARGCFLPVIRRGLPAIARRTGQLKWVLLGSRATDNFCK